MAAPTINTFNKFLIEALVRQVEAQRRGAPLDRYRAYGYNLNYDDIYRRVRRILPERLRRIEDNSQLAQEVHQTYLRSLTGRATDLDVFLREPAVTEAAHQPISTLGQAGEAGGETTTTPRAATATLERTGTAEIRPTPTEVPKVFQEGLRESILNPEEPKSEVPAVFKKAFEKSRSPLANFFKNQLSKGQRLLAPLLNNPKALGVVVGGGIGGLLYRLPGAALGGIIGWVTTTFIFQETTYIETVTPPEEEQIEVPEEGGPPAGELAGPGGGGDFNPYNTYNRLRSLGRTGRRALARELEKDLARIGARAGISNLARAGAAALGWKIWLVIGIILLVVVFFFFFSGGFQELRKNALTTLSPPTQEAQPAPIKFGSSDLTCTTSMSTDDINSFFQSNNFYNFYGTGDQFVQFAQKYGINPAIIIAIGMHESMLGNLYTGSSAENDKNAFGIQPTYHVNKGYSSWIESAEDSFASVANYKCDTIECVSSHYAEDPNWPNAVRTHLATIPHKSCIPSNLVVGPDQPSGWPVSGIIEQLPFDPNGISHARFHENAVDIATPNSTSVYSTLNGEVSAISYQDYGGYGVFVSITNRESGAQIILAHMIPSSNSSLQVGQTVTKGMQIGLSDDTGFSQDPHVHYEILGSIATGNFADFIPERNLYNGMSVSVGNSPEWGPNAYFPAGSKQNQVPGAAQPGSSNL